MSGPTALYTNTNNETETKEFTVSKDVSNLSSDGTTTGPSPYLLESTNGEYIDKDKPAPLNLGNPMGVLRGQVTDLQDQINVFLTERIQQSKNGDVEEIDEDEDEEKEDNEDEE